jgi:hypothetical protein
VVRCIAGEFPDEIVSGSGENVKRLFVALFAVSALIVPLSAHHTPSASADGVKCPKGYKLKDGKCVRQGAGTFSIALAGTQIRLTGTTTRSNRTPFRIARITVPGLRANAQAFKIFAAGRIPILRLATKGTLYKLNVATHRWMAIKTITTTGIYQAVFR